MICWWYLYSTRRAPPALLHQHFGHGFMREMAGDVAEGSYGVPNFNSHHCSPKRNSANGSAHPPLQPSQDRCNRIAGLTCLGAAIVAAKMESCGRTWPDILTKLSLNSWTGDSALFQLLCIIDIYKLILYSTHIPKLVYTEMYPTVS